MVHLRRVWPLAQLTAMLGNVNGGKAEGGKKMDPRKTFTAQEFLPWFARPEGFGPPPPALEPHHCAWLVEAAETGLLKNASWVVQIVNSETPWEQVVKTAQDYRDQEAGEPEFGG